MKYPKGSEWHKRDLHIHSIHSCEPRAKLTGENIFDAASVNNIAVISITDHSNVGGLFLSKIGCSIETEISHLADDAPTEELLYTLGPQKEILMSEFVDIFELPNWSAYHQKQKDFHLTTVNKPSVVFSDSHSTYTNSCPAWIKADPTFEGLKQAQIYSICFHSTNRYRAGLVQ